MTKSGLMVGLGETHDEMVETFAALREHGVQVLTVGQYLRPSERHLPVVRYWHPDEFAALERAAYELGFDHVAAGPLVRSSYHADQHVPQPRAGVGPLAAARHEAPRRHARSSERSRQPLAGASTAPRRAPQRPAHVPAQGQHPAGALPARHGRAGRDQRDRLPARDPPRRQLLRRPVRRVAVHYGAIPYELTHPGKHCDADRARRVATSSPCTARRTARAAPRRSAATWVTAFTSMFLHAGLLHIVGNMLFLAIFGPTSRMRSGACASSSSTCSAASSRSRAQVLVSPDSTGPDAGASGAIAAVLGGYIAALSARARADAWSSSSFFFTLVELPAVFLLGFWFLEQVYFGVAGLTNPVGGGGGVAYFAHVGGFVFGLLLIGLFAERKADSRRRAPGVLTASAAARPPTHERARSCSALALVFIAGFALPDLRAMIEQGFTLASCSRSSILVLLGVGIVGALRNPPR